MSFKGEVKSEAKVWQGLQGVHLCRGFTLVEMMVVVVIAAILASMAAPSFDDFFRKSRVKGATEEVYGLLLQAKSEAPIRDTDISINTSTGSDPWCVGYSTVANCDCTNTTSCVVPVAGTNVLQVVNGTDYDDVTISETFAGTGSTFNRIRGTASAGKICVISDDWQLDINVSTYGRIKICNPNDNIMTGYESCPQGYNTCP